MEQYHLRITKVTGLVILAQRSTQTYTGTKAELAEIYKKILMHNLLFGWWGIIAFVWNIMVLYRNSKAKKLLQTL